MSDATIRLAIFLVLWTLLALAELRTPRQQRPPQRSVRWPINLCLAAVDTLCLRLLIPWLAVDAARWAAEHRIGVLHLMSTAPWLAAVAGFAALDLVIYFQHRLMHAVPLLWRLHRVHHTDLALDVSSGTRFHPLEILLSMALKIGTVLVFGIGAAVMLAFEIVLSSFSLMTHANLAIPERWERALRWVVVTPDMHRIHHSVDPAEHNRNFCFHLSCWDRLFGTYCVAPASSQQTLPLGLRQYPEPCGFLTLLVLPFQ